MSEFDYAVVIIGSGFGGSVAATITSFGGHDIGFWNVSADHQGKSDLCEISSSPDKSSFN